MPLLRLQTRTDGAVPSPPAPTPLTRRHPFAFVQRVDDEPTTTSFVSVGRHSSTEGHREFKTVSGNGPEWVTFHLRACVATGRAHCAVEPQEPPRAMQASEVFLLRLSVQVPDYFGPHSTFSNISTIRNAIDTRVVSPLAAAVSL